MQGQAGDHLAGKQFCRGLKAAAGREADPEAAMWQRKPKAAASAWGKTLAACQGRRHSSLSHAEAHLDAGWLRWLRNYEESLRELGLFSLEKRRFGGILSMCRNTWWEGVEEMEAGSSPWWPATGQERTSTNMYRKFNSKVTKHFVIVRMGSIRMGCAKKLWSLSVRRYSEPDWKWLLNNLSYLF